MEKKEYLDTLRYLNKNNINENQELRDSLFNSLMICDDNTPSYLKGLSDAYYKEFEAEYKDNIAKDFILSSIFSDEIKRQLTDHLIQDNEDCLLISGRGAAHALTYVGAVKGAHSLVKKSPEHFAHVKLSLLCGLIIRYCKDLGCGRNNVLPKLNKLIVIYAEHIRGIEPTEDIPMIIDEGFLNEIKENQYNVNSKNALDAVNHLVWRKYPIERKDKYSHYEDDYHFNK